MFSTDTDTETRQVVDEEIDPERMRATGYADTKPKAPNRDPDGVQIPENMAANRRVTIRVYPMSLEEKANYEAILDMREQKELEQEAIIEQNKPKEELPQLKMQ